MNKQEFNLIDEPWIVMLESDGKTEKVSLRDAFSRAGEFIGLAGELPTQNVAIMRLMLAILHTVVSRYDIDGEESPLESPPQALRRWKAIYESDQMPMGVINAYLDKWHDRFYLFDSERPFYQIPDIGKATDYTASKLNGELSESNNKVRLFPQRSGCAKAALDYDEAARWLLYVNAFDDTSAKKVGSRDLPSPGAGWLGKLGLIMADGRNFFETLMLNLVLLPDGANSLWNSEIPIWERETVKRAERTEIALPDNPAELYTLQSRRIMLKRFNNKVTGYLLLGGDFFIKDNAFNEQMTVWRNATKNNKSAPLYQPRRHDPSRQLWRDFSVLLAENTGGRRPGIVGWIARLKRSGMLKGRIVKLRTACAKYADKDFFIDDVSSDTMEFSAEMLTEKGEKWIPLVTKEIEITDKLIENLGFLAQRVAKSAGDADGKFDRLAAREQAYYKLDIPFREWLESIDAENDDMSDVTKKWWEIAQRAVRDIGRNLVASAGPKALVGRTIKENNTERHYCAPDAYNYFLNCTKDIETLMKGGK